MIKIFYNKYQFIEGEDKGKKNLEKDGVKLLHTDVEYVPGTNNKIVVGASEEDKEDWEKFSASMKEFMQYFEDVMMERVQEDKRAVYADNAKLIEENFVVVQK